LSKKKNKGVEEAMEIEDAGVEVTKKKKKKSKKADE
jgi:hypothetical protein